jgi:hypothetical protein
LSRLHLLWLLPFLILADSCAWNFSHGSKLRRKYVPFIWWL